MSDEAQTAALSTHSDRLSSLAITSALDHLRYANRLLRDDEQERSMLSVGGGLGPVSLSDNRSLTKALLEMLEKLLDPRENVLLSNELGGRLNHPSTNSRLRQHLSVAGELSTILRTKESEGSQHPAEALRLARRLTKRRSSAASQEEVLPSLSLFSPSSSSSIPMKHRARDQTLLLERKRRMADVGNDRTTKTGRGELTTVEEANAYRATKSRTYLFPGQDKAKDLVELSCDDDGLLRFENGTICRVLAVWRKNLTSEDAEAAASLTCSTEFLEESCVLIRICLDQVGVALLWIRGERQAERWKIERFNLLAESEMRQGMDGAETLDAVYANPSCFPLYRQITGQLLSKVLDVDVDIPSSRFTPSSSPLRSSLVVIVNSLFAIASLCHLHDPFPSIDLHSRSPPRGTAAVLSALAMWSPFECVSDEIEVNADQKGDEKGYEEQVEEGSVANRNDVSPYPFVSTSLNEASGSREAKRGYCDFDDDPGDGDEAVRLDPDAVADACLERYRHLDRRAAKPGVRADGRFEWTILSGVVLSWPQPLTIQKSKAVKRRISNGYRCISLSTGVKAQPITSLSPFGDILHDCHAEILARRACRSWILQRLLLEESKDDAELADATDGIPRIFSRSQDQWRLRKGVHFHLYSSTLPCGDFSSLLIAPQHDEGEKVGYRAASQPLSSSALRGRDVSGRREPSIRTKPGRPQAKPTISMSCSDKIAMWDLVGFQGSLLSRWLSAPLFFSLLVVGDEATRGVKGEKNLIENCERILRAKTLCDSTNVQIRFTGLRFADGREQRAESKMHTKPNAKLSGPSDELDIVPCAASLVWIDGQGVFAVVEGRKQGAPLKRIEGQPLRPSSRVPICKLDWFQAIRRAESRLSSYGLASSCPPKTYYGAKHDADCASVLSYRRQKDLIRGLAAVDMEKKRRIEWLQVNEFLRRTADNLIDWSNLRSSFDKMTMSFDGGGAKDEQERQERPCDKEMMTESAIHADEFRMVGSDCISLLPLRGWLVSGRTFENFTA